MGILVLLYGTPRTILLAHLWYGQHLLMVLGLAPFACAEPQALDAEPHDSGCKTHGFGCKPQGFSLMQGTNSFQLAAGSLWEEEEAFASSLCIALAQQTLAPDLLSSLGFHFPS